MFLAYLSPLAPAVILLLSAFVLSVIMPRIPVTRGHRPWTQYFLAPGLVGLAIVSLLAIRLTFDRGKVGLDLETLSGWPLSAEVAALSFRADGVSLTLLMLILLLLLVVALITSPYYSLSHTAEQENLERVTVGHWWTTSGWLLVGAAACLVLLSANMTILTYTVLAFDGLLMIFWLKRGQNGLAIARLFLGILSASAVALSAALISSEIAMSGEASLAFLFLSVALWLRLALYPFIEITEKGHWQEHENLAYFGLTFVVGVYLISQTMSQPLPESMLWLTTIMMLLSGMLAWLTERVPLRLLYLVLTEFLLLLLAGPLPEGVIVAAGLSLVLSLIALSVTPRLGRPNLAERAWLWPYLPAATATLTILGVPFFLGWPVWLGIYQKLILLDSLVLIILALLAQMLAISSLVRFWLTLWQGQNGDKRRLAIGVLVMVPFLLPGLAPLVFEKTSRMIITAADLGRPALTGILLLAVSAGAVALQYFKEQVLDRLKIAPETLIEFAQLRWFWPQSAQWLKRVGQLLLRLDIILEGQHYIGWAIFVTIIGALVVLLRV